MQESNALRGLVWMGAGGEDGASYQIVGALLLGVYCALVIVDGAANFNRRVGQGPGLGGGEGVFAEVNAVGTAEEGNVDSLVNDEEGFAVDGVFEFQCKVEQMASGEVFLTELDYVDAAFDGLAYPFDQGRIVAEAAVRYQAEGRAWEGESWIPAFAGMTVIHKCH